MQIEVWECSGNYFYSTSTQESFTLSPAGQLQTLSTADCTQLTRESPKPCWEHLALLHPAVRRCAGTKAMSVIIPNQAYCAFFGKHTSSFVLGKSRDTPWFTRRALAEAVELETYLWWQTQGFLNMYFNLRSYTELPHPAPANTILDIANISLIGNPDLLSYSTGKDHYRLCSVDTSYDLSHTFLEKYCNFKKNGIDSNGKWHFSSATITIKQTYSSH